MAAVPWLPCIPCWVLCPVFMPDRRPKAMRDIYDLIEDNPTAAFKAAVILSKKHGLSYAFRQLFFSGYPL